MKPIILAVFMLFFSSLLFTANAGTVTTTTTTVTTVKKYSCNHHRRHHRYRRHRCYSCSCPYYGCYTEYYQDSCPGGGYDCYYDLEGDYFRQTYLPVTYDHEVQYSCLASDDPSSCS